MSGPVLSRGALAGVLQSLLTAEWRACRGGGPAARLSEELPVVWPGNLRIVDDEDGASLSLGADSLELLRLSAAVNEMFHLYESGCERELLAARTMDDWLDVIEENWRAGVTRITFLSSGSTGALHRCTHEASFLAEEIDYLARLFDGRRRIVSQVPTHHIFGFLFGGMLGDRLGVEVVRGSGVRGPMGEMRAGDLMVAVPEQWEWLNRSVGRWPADVHGVTSTAPCPRALIASLMDGGLGGMTEVYGSSETSGVGVRRWPAEEYEWMPQWKAVEYDQGGETRLVHVSGVRMELMDRISARGDRRFLVDGRRDHAVQVGGTNVYPERIAAKLRALPGVEDVSVRLMRAEEGTRLKAFVVPETGRRREEVEQEIVGWVRGHLTAPERPKSWTFGAALPVNAMGKAADW